MNNFIPTHVIVGKDGTETLVMLDNQNLYTEEEWNDYERADWTLIDGVLCFQGSFTHQACDGVSYHSVNSKS